jgi:hypothetical protein
MYPRTMMIEFLHTFITSIAMFHAFFPQYAAISTDIFFFVTRVKVRQVISRFSISRLDKRTKHQKAETHQNQT